MHPTAEVPAEQGPATRHPSMLQEQPVARRQWEQWLSELHLAH